MFQSTVKKVHTLWLLVHTGILLLFVFTLTACDAIGAKLEYQPPIPIPLKVTVNTWGEVTLESSTQFATPLGTFEIGLITDPTKYFDTIQNALTIRIGGSECMYDLNGHDFEINLEAEEFRLISLRKENKSIYLELSGDRGINCKQNIATSVSKRAQASPDALNCPGASPSHLAIGATAYISVFQASVHQFPNEFPPLVENKYLKQNRVVTIIDGPICGEGNPGHALFWKVRSEEITFSSGKRGIVVGWVAEESGDVYLLKPR